MNFLNRFKRSEYIRLQFFMRSGQSFIIDGVESCDIEANDGKITSLTLTQDKSARKARLLVASVDLGQIEAVVRLPN